MRQAARHVTQFYDRFLAPSGLSTPQFSILAKLGQLGPLTINALAAELVMDRTTLGRNIQPLDRAGLITIVPGTTDRRRKELRLTASGNAAVRAAAPGWKAAQRRFSEVMGGTRAAELRALLRSVTDSELVPRAGDDAT